LPRACFYADRKRPSGVQSYCRKCKLSVNGPHVKRAKRPIRRRNRLFVRDHLSSHPCVDCGESDPVVLDFDHIDCTAKKKAVSRMVSDCYSLGDIRREISKCEVRCANCHRRRTAAQFGWNASYFL
jgi:hypothetical protein